MLAPTPGQIDGLTSWTLIRTAHQVERELTALFARFDLSPVQFGVLVYLAAAEQLTQAELARLVLVRPQSMSTVLEGMVSRGLLVRAGDRQRGRPSPLSLSEPGVRLLEAAWVAAQTADQQIFSALDAAQREQLNHTIHQVLGG